MQMRMDSSEPETIEILEPSPEPQPPTPPTPTHRGLTIRIRDLLSQHHCLPFDGVVTVVTAQKTGHAAAGRYEKAQCRYCRALIALDDKYPPAMSGREMIEAAFYHYDHAWLSRQDDFRPFITRFWYCVSTKPLNAKNLELVVKTYPNNAKNHPNPKKRFLRGDYLEGDFYLKYQGAGPKTIVPREKTCRLESEEDALTSWAEFQQSLSNQFRHNPALDFVVSLNLLQTFFRSNGALSCYTTNAFAQTTFTQLGSKCNADWHFGERLATAAIFHFLYAIYLREIEPLLPKQPSVIVQLVESNTRSPMVTTPDSFAYLIRCVADRAQSLLDSAFCDRLMDPPTDALTPMPDIRPIVSDFCLLALRFHYLNQQFYFDKLSARARGALSSVFPRWSRVLDDGSEQIVELGSTSAFCSCPGILQGRYIVLKPTTVDFPPPRDHQTHPNSS